MLMYNTHKQSMVSEKSEQFKQIGLTGFELSKITEIVDFAVANAQTSNEDKNSQLWNIMNVSNYNYPYSPYGQAPYAVTYNINTGDYYQYNIGSINHEAVEMMDLKPSSYSYIMNNSYGNSMNEIPDHTNSSRKTTDSENGEENLKSTKSSKTLDLATRLSQLQNLLEGISDEDELLISAKPKNRSYKIRKSNRYSRYRGVSLNGKKWQVMIMGPAKKKYFGAISNEKDAAVLYDKLSILTNGLAAKTNFNYRKSDLTKMMHELEYMQHIVSN